MVKAKDKIDLTKGPLFTRMLLFVIPVMLTGILQVMYNMADNIVVGQFSGDPDALAAVGSTSSFTNLIVCVMLGFSAGAGAVIAQFLGARNHEEVSRSSHTAMLFSLIGGIAVMTVGLIITRPVLTVMGTKADILDKSVLYMTIICLGIPATSIYNFGSAVLRSAGDSKTSLLILASSGMANVLFNLFFVMVCNMSVEGVAIATIISQYISASAVVAVLVMRKNTPYALSFKKLRIEGRLLKRIFKFGAPIALQSLIFSVSNVLIASAVNTFPKTTVSGSTIASNIDGITYTAMNSFSHAALTFIGQNYGAGEYRRMNKILLYLIIQVTAIGIFIGQTELLFGRQLAMLYVNKSDPNKEAVIAAALEICAVILNSYFLCGIMDAISGTLKALGFSISSMISSLIGVAVRVVWVLAVTPKMHTIFGLYVSYIISWLITIAIHSGICVYVWRKLGIWRGAKEQKRKLYDENINQKREYSNSN